jgi:membrane-associated phospholipid phosphatase
MVLLVLLLVGTVVALLVLAVSVARPGQPVDAIDPERPERWLVRHAPRWARRPLRTADRRVVGGAATVVVFGLLFGAALLVGWVFDGIDEGRGWARWDESAAEWGAANATEASTDTLKVITELGGTTWLIIAMAVVGIWHLARHRRPGPLLFLMVVGIGVSLLNNGLKLIVDRERPDIAQLAGHAGASFPSGHSAAAAACWAALALVLTRRMSRRWRVVAAAVAALIAVAVASSRVLLGVHWVSDVIAGVVVGWTWFLLVAVVFGGRLLRLGEPAERIAAKPTPPADERHHSTSTGLGARS